MTNPLLQDWDTPHGLAPFERIEDAHFAPALDLWGQDTDLVLIEDF